MTRFSKKSFFICLVFLLILNIAITLVYFERQYRAHNGYSFLFGKRPLISVVVTSYNYENYLPQTLSSIVGQTYKKYEVVIVDDGSKDDSVELIKKYTDKYPNFHLYQHEKGVNKGLPASVRLGIEKAKGKYIAFLESDDYWREDKLKEVVKLINKYPDAKVISNGVFPFTEERELSLIPTKIYLDDVENRLKEKNEIIADDNDLLYSVVPTMSSLTVRKDVLKEFDLNPPLQNALDIWLYRQMFKKYPLYHTSKVLTYWRKHSGSLGGDLANRDNESKRNHLIRAIRRMLSTN